MCRHSATFLVWQLLQTAGRRRGLTAEEVAEALSLEPEAARRALEVLQMAGVVEEGEGRVVLTVRNKREGNPHAKPVCSRQRGDGASGPAL